MADLLSFLNEKEEDPLQLFSLLLLLFFSRFPCLSSLLFLRRSSPSLFLARGLCLAQKRNNVNA